MRKLFYGVALLSLTGVSGFGSTFLFQGTFATDDQVALFNFAVNNPNTAVTIQSYGYAGGTVDSTPIAAGGFAPNAIIFDSTGTEIGSDNGGHCGVTGQDASTGNCDDPYYQNFFDPGVYTLALVVWDNTSLDGNLFDGFTQDGNPGFTCVEAGVTGNFCDVTTATGVSRTGDYAVAITGADSAQVAPEPASFALGFSALLAAALMRRRRCFQQ
jgi:MYXO-CTERM domain-containing protein